MTDKHWKRHEREIAKRLSGVRLPNNGHGQPDVLAGNLAIEVKTRRQAPTWLIDAVDQASRNAPIDHLPAVVLALPVTGVGTRRLLVIDLDDITAEVSS